MFFTKYNLGLFSGLFLVDFLYHLPLAGIQRVGKE